MSGAEEARAEHAAVDGGKKTPEGEEKSPGEENKKLGEGGGTHNNLEDKEQELESSKEVGLGDIAKDLNKIKRQNKITHILLGTVIVMTALWQLKEVSFLLAVQKKLRDPFKPFGDMIKSTLKRGGEPIIEASSLPPVGIPDVTQTDLSTLAIGNSDG